MLPRGYLWFVRLIALLSFLIFGFIIFKIDPEKSFWAKPFFYLVFFFFTSALFNLFLLRLRRRTMRGELVSENIALSLRQGLLIAFFTTSLLIIQGFRMLLWWVGLLLLAGIFLVELYFLSREE